VWSCVARARVRGPAALERAVISRSVASPAERIPGIRFSAATPRLSPSVIVGTEARGDIRLLRGRRVTRMTVVAGPEPGDMRQPIRSRLRCRVLARPEAVSVAMHDPPPAASTPADVRHPERSLTAGRAVDQAHVRFYVDRVGQVTARAGREVADVDVPLPETAGRPVQTPADGVPALLVPSPIRRSSSRHPRGPQLLVGASVAVDEPLESPSTLIAELIPAGHLPLPLSARYPSENP
jgi:hypothetical protein